MVHGRKGTATHAAFGCTHAPYSHRVLFPHLQCHARMVTPLAEIICKIPVPPEVQALMSIPRATLTFVHVDPTEALVRMLVAGPLAAARENLQFFPRSGTQFYEGGLQFYDDFADGERMARIQAAIPEGTAALTSVLFFDKINRDAKGFNFGEGAIIVGGFFKRYHIRMLPPVGVL